MEDDIECVTDILKDEERGRRDPEAPGDESVDYAVESKGDETKK